MKLEELRQHYGNWTQVSLQLKISYSALTYWRNQGFIPYDKQCLIEVETNELFKARKEDAVKE